MVLNRQALESKLLQQLLAHPELDFKIWTDEELLRSIEATLKQQSSDELWIFAYGSLIWNPLFNYLDRRSVVVKGWQRQFCLLAPVGRGTIDNPGLVLGLKPGNCCQGIAYRLPVDENLKSELLLLWRREMVVGSYIPRWITGTIGDKSSDMTSLRQIDLLAFTVNLQHSVYVDLPLDRVVESLATAEGVLGSSAEYLSHTVRGLLAENIADVKLTELDRLVKRRQQELAYRRVE